MTWEIVVGIIALVGFVGTTATYASKQASILAGLKTTLDALNKTLEELKENNKQNHKVFFTKLDDHESRIIKLEAREK